MTEKKRLSRKAAFLKWASKSAEFGHYSDLMVLEGMNDVNSCIGLAWSAWKAAWKAKS